MLFYRSRSGAAEDCGDRAVNGERSTAGFTLLEVMIAIGILTVMMTMAWSTLSSSAQTKKHFEALQERNHEIRLAMARMVSDLSMAYLSANEDQNAVHRRTVFVGKTQRECG